MNKKKLTESGVDSRTNQLGYPDDAEVPLWGFEFTRTDGSKIWLHPDAQTKSPRKILCRMDGDELMQPPVEQKKARHRKHSRMG